MAIMIALEYAHGELLRVFNSAFITGKALWFSTLPILLIVGTAVTEVFASQQVLMFTK